jgi:hypothetical protein
VSYRPPPPVDPRTEEDFVAQTERLLERYTGWTPPAGDPAAALVRVFARMAARVADRLNRVPDRNFLAFLELIGVEPLPPQPARVPLTFSLAAGATGDAVVPARTPVAGRPLEGEAEPPVFETERELVVTRTTLEAVVVHDPARGRWDDRTAQAAAGIPFAAFTGDTPLEQRLHLSHRAAFGADTPKTVRLRLTLDDTVARWADLVEWSWRGAEGGQPATPGPVSHGMAWEATFTKPPAVPLTQVDRVEGAWLTARLGKPPQLRGAAPRAVLAGGAWWEPGETLFPFGRTQPADTFAFSAPEVFGVPGAAATLEVALDPAFPAPAADVGLRLEWEYNTAAGWQPLGASTPGAASAGTTEFAFSDGTLALTQDGSITFHVPRGWVPHALQRREGTWLRASVADGGYAAGAFRPPAVRRLAPGYSLALPAVTGVEAQVELARVGLLPPAGAFGTSELDLSKDFLPFGARPALGDAFYLALPQLLERPGAKVALRVTVNPFATAAPAGWVAPTLCWEFWSAATARWEPFGESKQTTPAAFSYGFSDATGSLGVVGRGEVRFNAPALGRVEVNGRRDAWIRVRIAGGDYGQDVRYEEAQSDGKTTVIVHPPTYRPPSVAALELGFEWTSPWTTPDAAVIESDWARARLAPVAGGALPSFVPFAPPADLRPSLYLGFLRPGDAAGFANRAATLYLGTAEVPFGSAGGLAPAEPAVLAWWYWNGAEWARLAVHDETAALTRRGMVTFVGPVDFRASGRFGREAFWLRATLERGGWTHPPRLERVLLNTVWAEHAARVAGEVLGSGTGRPGQRVRTARAPVLPGERIEVREAEHPSPPELAELEREGGPGAVAPAGDGAAGVWVRWTPAADFHASGPGSRHYVMDRAAGEVRFGDGTHGRAPPAGRGNLRAAHYRTGGGPAGNRPAGDLAVLKTPVPYLDRVTNPEPAAGGAAAESLDAVRVRGPRTLRHRGRAVTLADLQDLTMEASPEVAAAHAVGPADAGDEGRVRVVVVPRGAAARPAPSPELLERVQVYLAERLPATVELEVRGPEWVEVAVTVEVVAVTPEAAAAVQAALPARLAGFLHPLAGGPRGEGWPFGRRPRRSDLFGVVEATPGVDHVRLLEVRESPFPRTPFFLVCSGVHAVRVAGDTHP